MLRLFRADAAAAAAPSEVVVDAATAAEAPAMQVTSPTQDGVHPQGEASAGESSAPAPAAASVATGALRQRAGKKDAILARVAAIEVKLDSMALGMAVLTDVIARVARLEQKDATPPPAGVDQLDQM